jgi:hypothetical protein
LSDNVTDLFADLKAAQQQEEKPLWPNYNYTITLKNKEGPDTEVTTNGYILINSVWFGVARGVDTILHYAWPIEMFGGIRNLGPASTVLN